MLFNNIILILLLILNAKNIYSYRINPYNKILSSSSSLKKTSSSNLYQSKSSDNITPSSSSTTTTLIVNNDNDTHDKLRKWFLLNHNVRPEIYYANVKDLPTLMNVLSESILLSLRVLQV